MQVFGQVHSVASIVSVAIFSSKEQVNIASTIYTGVNLISMARKKPSSRGTGGFLSFTKESREIWKSDLVYHLLIS